MLLKRRDDDPIFPGYWDLPGGGVDAGEDLAGTLVREFREETGLSVRVGRPLHISIQRYPVRGEDTIEAVLVVFECTARTTKEPRLDPAEHTAYAWVTKRQLRGHAVMPTQREGIQAAFKSQMADPASR